MTRVMGSECRLENAAYDSLRAYIECLLEGKVLYSGPSRVLEDRRGSQFVAVEMLNVGRRVSNCFRLSYNCTQLLMSFP